MEVLSTTATGYPGRTHRGTARYLPHPVYCDQRTVWWRGLR